METLIGILVCGILLAGSFVIACISTGRAPREVFHELKNLIKGDRDG